MDMVLGCGEFWGCDYEVRVCCKCGRVSVKDVIEVWLRVNRAFQVRLNVGGVCT